MSNMPGHQSSVALICTANRCRSVIAHAIFVDEVAQRSLSITTYSAGVLDFRDAPPIDDTTVTCELHHTPAPNKPPTWVRDLPLESITRFLVMERYHADVLTRSYGIAPDRISLLGEFDPHGRGDEIDDPFDQSRSVYDHCYARIRDCIVNYLETEQVGKGKTDPRNKIR
jgi:protein-tyrosine-phosphatase